jgi:hypothetical protein
MITITIMVILATVALYTMVGVQQMAKNQRCKAQIARLHQIIADKWESYETRRYPPPSPSPPGWWNGWYGRLVSWDSTLPYRLNAPDAWKAFDRLWKIRETMRMDMPDRATDIRTVRRPSGAWNTDSMIPVTTDAKYFIKFIGDRTYKKFGIREEPPWTDRTVWKQQYAAAECLYMIISLARVGDSSALEFFGEKEIGDKDGDGLPEIWDPWGKPITFIRWPTGFDSPLQDTPIGLPTSSTPYDRNEYPPDAFDFLNVDTGGYFHFSLIASAGPDGEFGFAIERRNQRTTPLEAAVPAIDFSNPGNVGLGVSFPQDYPTEIFGDSNDPWRLGSQYPNESGVYESSDNIHNHLIETKTN